MSTSKFLRTVTVLVAAIAFASASHNTDRQILPRNSNICSPGVPAAPPGPGLAEIDIAENQTTAAWASVVDVGTSLQLIQARAIRNTQPEGTILVQYAFTKVEHGLVAYQWHIYQANTTDVAPTSDQFTLLTNETEVVENRFLGLVRFCIKDNGGQRLLVLGRVRYISSGA